MEKNLNIDAIILEAVSGNEFTDGALDVFFVLFEREVVVKFNVSLDQGDFCRDDSFNVAVGGFHFFGVVHGVISFNYRQN